MPESPEQVILVIEDNFFMAQLLSEKISHQGYSAIQAHSGTLGITEIDKHTPALIIIDIPLSGDMNGVDTLAAMRGKVSLKEVPILILFNSPESKEIDQLKALGYSDYLIKATVNADTIVEKAISMITGTLEKSTLVLPPADGIPSTVPSKPAPPTGAYSNQGDISALAKRAVALKTEVVELLKLPEEQISIIQLVDNMMIYAFMARASDVHLEPFEDSLVARMRIDGILSDEFTFQKSLHSGIVSRIKVLGGMRTDEHQAAQDGRFQMNIPELNKQFDVRVSIIPTYYGENGVLRLLAEQTSISSLDNLAFTDFDRARIRKAVKTPYGMILATGPTGSGKTTTLYTILRELNTREVSVITIEDPIEYSLEGVDQIQVNARTGLTFATGLRSILRQDPNIIMVGEIRDEETASIAINAALTGHKLLSTIHTNDAATTLPRLLDMGIEPFLVASTVNLAIGQRLVRMICNTCKVARRISEAEYNALKENVPESILEDHHDFFQGKGCDSCGLTGYRGRMGIYEILEMNDFVREALMRRADAGEIKKIAIKNGMTTLLEDGFRKAVEGRTTIEEILRVIHE